MRPLKDSKKFQRHTLGKWSLRGISLFMAATLWFYVVNSEPIVVEKRVPLNFITPDGSAISSVIDWHVDIELQGARAFMQNLFDAGESIEINLTAYDYRLGESFSVSLGASDVPLGFGVEVLSISPDRFDISLENREEKDVEVRAQFIGSLPDELNLIHQSLSPSSVRITGPRSMLSGLERIRTTPIDLSALRNTGIIMTQAHSPDRRIEIISEEDLEFEYEVRPSKANITLTNVPVHFLASAKKFEAQQRHVALDVMAPEGEDGRVRKSQIRVIAEVPEGATGVVDVDLRAELPEGIFLLQIHPERIRVVIEDE